MEGRDCPWTLYRDAFNNVVALVVGNSTALFVKMSPVRLAICPETSSPTALVMSISIQVVIVIEVRLAEILRSLSTKYYIILQILIFKSNLHNKTFALKLETVS